MIRLRLSSVGDYLQRESLVIRILYALSEKSFRCFVPKDLQVIERSTIQPIDCFCLVGRSVQVKRP